MLAVIVALWQVLSPAPSPLTDQDAYALYNMVIHAEWPVRVAHAKQIVIQDTTEIGSISAPPCYPKGTDIDNGQWGPALADFKRQNAQSWALLQQFSLDVPYELEGKEDLGAFFRARGADGWDDFNAAHPDSHGYIILSAVGFSPDRTKAIVYVAHHCGGLCGAGGYHFLERKAGVWTEARPNVEVCRWIS
jgi:hypothetical protein